MQRLESVSEEASENVGSEDTALFGGYVLDSVLENALPVHDIDVAVQWKHLSIAQCVQRLREKGFRIIDDTRQYLINMTTKVGMVFAEKTGTTYDISFLDDFNDIGQYDVETMYWDHRSARVADNHGALKAHEKKTLRPVRGLDGENPYLLLNRLLYLCAKYHYPIAGNTAHEQYIARLLCRLREWQHPHHFHSVECRTAFYSKLLRSILQAQDRAAYWGELQHVGLLQQLLPELERCADEKELYLQMERATTKWDIFSLLYTHADPQARAALLEKFSALKTRNWDEEDQCIAQALSSH